MPKKRSKPKELERIEIIEAAREESDDEAQQPHELPADAAHADFVKVWSAKMSDADGVLMRYPRAIGGAAAAGLVLVLIALLVALSPSPPQPPPPPLDAHSALPPLRQPTSPAPPPAKCVDTHDGRHDWCEEKRQAGLCNRPSVRQQCERTCNICASPPSPPLPPTPAPGPGT